MKILLLASGKDIHSVRWANQLSKNGNVVHLCYVSDHKPSLDKFNPNIFLHELKFKSPYGYYLNVSQLKNIINYVKPDIFNAHYASGYGTLGRMCNFSPYMLSVYGSDVYDFPYKRKINMQIIKKNLKSANVITSTSHSMANQVTRLIDIPLEKIYTVPFGVDITKFRKKNTEKESNQIVIGSVKKLSPKYGIKYGILAVHHLVKELLRDKKEKTRIRYLIYGEGKERNTLKKLVEECKLQDIVEFKGRIPNNMVPNALNNLDIFLGTSVLDSESFGVAIVEAMACEVPVIVTDVDGFKEVVDEGAAGIIVPRKDYKEMGKQIFNIINNPKKRIELGRIERIRVIKHYNWMENVKKMETIYNKAIEIFQIK